MHYACERFIAEYEYTRRVDQPAAGLRCSRLPECNASAEPIPANEKLGAIAGRCTNYNPRYVAGFNTGEGDGYTKERQVFW